MGKLKKSKKNIDQKPSESAIDDEVPTASNIIKSKKKHKLEEESKKIHKIKKKNTVKNIADDDEIIEPSLDLLKESEKPEYNLNIKSGRSKKKEKLQNILIEKKHEFQTKDIEKNSNYLNNWKSNHDVWKFEKLRQLSIQLSMFDEQKINEKLWPIALEYLAASKGAAKLRIIELAEKQIDDLDQEITSTKNNELFQNYKYCRAREILQSFD